ncbi:hypothetical protein [Micromonospora inyonensis]|uniref:Uncharacterized protein n=1 Tax=Micromonospora inyonensis TaxID=47866 RepID=A0A1C6SMS4_9ACTN|nr:hypothetical protein [Micromonospora inyonensis]SCL30770.1 hypothetical protein GA0074694_5793 [Micromonospora inyonensis]
MRTATGERLNQRERHCLWSPDELVEVYEDALGDPEIWDDVLDAARRARRDGFGNTVGRASSVASVGPDDRLDAPAGQPTAYFEVLDDVDTARQVALLAQLRQELGESAILAAVPAQYDLEALRSLRRAGADACVCKDHNGQTAPAALKALLDAQNAAFAAGFTRLGLTATIGANAARQLASVLLQSNHLMEELGLHPHTIAVRRDPGEPQAGVANGSRDPFLLQIALLRLAHPYSNIMVPAHGEAELLLRQLDVGANLVAGGVPSAATAEGYRVVATVDIEPELRELSYRRLPSMDHAGGLISEFRTKPTETYMLVRRPASPKALGNNLHRGLYRSKDPETVILVEGSLAITSRHPDRPEPTVVVITSTPQAPHKLTVPRNVYHEVVAEADSLLIEFSSVAEDTTDSFPWPLSST